MGNGGIRTRGEPLPFPPDTTGLSVFPKAWRWFNQKKQFGYIDSTGHIVVPLQFVHADPFSEGLALVYTTWGMNILGAEEGYIFFVRAGYIDHSGKFAIKPRYVENAASFSQGLAAFQAGANYGNGKAKWEVGH